MKKIILLSIATALFSLNCSESTKELEQKAVGSYSPIEKLPLEIIVGPLAGYLSQKDIARLACVNRQFNAAAKLAMRTMQFKDNSLSQITAALSRYAGTQLKELELVGCQVVPYKSIGNILPIDSASIAVLKLPLAARASLITDLITGRVSLLTHLKKLSLSNNSLHKGENLKLPDSLEELDLSECYLSKLPASVSTLPNLKRLNLGYDNFLSQTQDWILPSTLEVLNLESCGLQQMPASISTLPNLKELYFSPGGVAGQIDFNGDVNCDMVPNSVEKFSVGYKLAQIPPRIFTLTNLKELHLCFSAGLAGVQNWALLNNLPNLQKIHLIYCGITQRPAGLRAGIDVIMKNNFPTAAQ